MTILSDHSIRTLYPDYAASAQPSSLDLHLGDELLRLPYGAVLDPEQDQSALWEPVPLAADGRWWLGQGALYLGVTAESLAIPPDMVGLLHGVSSLGRLGLLVHVTAGVCDPGWSGRATLELVSLGGSMRLRPGQRIAQLTLHKLDQPASEGYVGRYLDDMTPVPSRSWMEAPKP